MLVIGAKEIFVNFLPYWKVSCWLQVEEIYRESKIKE
jgi:hypothetical protein